MKRTSRLPVSHIRFRRSVILMRIIPVLFLIPFLLTLLLPSARTETAEKTMTVMVYMTGSNLESLYGSATDDLAEMQASGFDAEQINLLVMTGGSREWKNALPDDENTILRFFARKGELHYRVEDTLASSNMGDPGTLRSFLDYAAEHCPAENYALILWDHGAGPVNGVCWDEQSSGDHLTIQELTSALSDSPFSQKKLAWLGFDACLMSSVEVARALAPYAEYMIASQAEEPATGWNYAFLKGLEDDADGGETGKRVVDSYFEVDTDAWADMTMACTWLDAVQAIEDAMDLMYGDLAAKLNRSSFSRLARLRQTATDFGRGISSSGSSTGYDLADLVSLCTSYAPEAPEASESVRKAVESAVIYARSSLEDCFGLNVYHPFRNPVRFREEWQAAYAALGFCPGYTAYVDTYGRIMSGDMLVRWNQLTDISAESSMVTLNLTEEQAENLSSARLVVLARNPFDFSDEAYFRVFSTADVNISGTRLSAWYDGTCLQALNEAGYDTLTGAISYRVTEDGTYIVPLYPFDENGQRVADPIWAEYEMDASGVLHLKGYAVFDAMTGMLSRRAAIDLDDFAGITFLNEYRNLTRNEYGEILAFDDWAEDTHRDTQWKARTDADRTRFLPSFALDASHAESLYAAYELTDTQGSYWMSELVPLDQGGMSFYQPDLSVAAGLAGTGAALEYLPESHSALVSLSLTNVSGQAQSYMLKGSVHDDDTFSGLKANGRDIAVHMQWLLTGDDGALVREPFRIQVENGQTAYLLFELDAQTMKDFDPEERLEEITGALYVSGAEDDLGSSMEFLIRTDFPLHALLTENADAPDSVPASPSCELVMPALSGKAFSGAGLAALRPAESAENSRLIVSLALKNTTDTPISFLIHDMTLNGVPVQGSAMSTEGTGEISPDTQKRTLAPGETGSASVSLKYEDVMQLMPDVSVQDIGLTLSVLQIEAGTSHVLSTLPLHFGTDISLEDFCSEASVLPPQELVDLGRASHALDASSEKMLLDTEKCCLSLQGMWLMGRNMVMLLEAENRTSSGLNLYLGQAGMDGMPAVIGQSRDTYALVRNRRCEVLGLTASPWPVGTGVNQTVHAGEKTRFYVSIAPESPEQTEVRELSFHAFLYDTASPLDCLYTDAIRIATDEPAPLQEDLMGFAEAGDFQVRAGQGVLPPPAKILSETGFTLPDPLPAPIRLTLTPGEGEKVQAGYAAIFRRVSSDAELAGMNILNTTDMLTGGPRISFSHGHAWLIYEAYVMLDPDSDGTASALYPMVRPVLETGSGRMPMVIADTFLQDSRLEIIQSGGHLSLLSGTFPGAVLGGGIGSITLEMDMNTRSGRMTSMKQAGDDYAALAGMIAQHASLIPEDTSPEEIGRFLNGDAPGTVLNQVLYLGDGSVQLTAEPVTDPEQLVVAFLYLTTDGFLRCTQPCPLLSFPAE